MGSPYFHFPKDHFRIDHFLEYTFPRITFPRVTDPVTFFRTEKKKKSWVFFFLKTLCARTYFFGNGTIPRIFISPGPFPRGPFPRGSFSHGPFSRILISPKTHFPESHFPILKNKNKIIN
jgi:hypothetical protein